MPVFCLYLLKLSLSLLVIYVFYRFVLRRLTFYNWNRFYLVAYTLAAFFIPLINITPVLERSETINNQVIRFIPSMNMIADKSKGSIAEANSPNLSTWDWMLLFFAAGACIMLVRLVIQLLSFRKLMKKASLLSTEGVKLYQVDGPVAPFSFGNSIFLNADSHPEDELREIIRHEFVHITQKHTLDILWSELLCILNWYNPFAWLIRKAIRQNLEFIADNQVLRSGIDKKEYQYLLLKVTGKNHFSIAQQFNFSSLKKRIVMMNKMKSAKINLIRFLFVLPLLAILVLAFRPGDTNIFHGKEQVTNGSLPGKKGMDIPPASFPSMDGEKKADSKKVISVLSSDTLPITTSAPNSKGYCFSILDDKGNCMIVIKNRKHQEVEKVLLVEWKERQAYYESRYGQLQISREKTGVTVIPSDFFNPDRKPLVIVDGKESNNVSELESMNPADIEEMTVLKEADAIAAYGEKGKNGVIIVATNNYSPDMTGEIKEVKAVAPVSTNVAVNKPRQPPTALTAPAEGTVKPPMIVVEKPAGIGENATPSATASAPKVPVTRVSPVKEPGTEKTIIAVIKNSTTENDLKKIEADLKSRGYDFEIHDVDYKNGNLVLIKGSIGKKKNKQYFSAADFAKLVITEVPEKNSDNPFNFLVMSGRVSVNDRPDWQ